MKFKNKLATVLLAGSIGLFSSCDESALLDLNVDKNAATSIDMAYLFSLGTLRIAGEYENTRVPMLYAATMIQHTASTAGYFSGDKYLYNAQYSGAYMQSHYTSVLRLLQHVISKTKDDPSMANFRAASMVLKAFDMHRMTDIYGDIPYTEAGKGLEGPEYWFPKYDSQKDVYNAMIEDLLAARALFSSSAKGFGTQDFIYGGDLAKWRKFTNALLMRIAMRMSKVDEARAKAVFTEANTNGAFTSLEDMATIKFASGPQGINRNGLNDGYWGNNKYSRDCKISATFLNWMRTNNDPRLTIVAGGIGNPDDPSTWVTDAASQKGLPNGYTSTTLRAQLTPDELTAYNANGNRIYSMLNLKYLDWEDPYYLISYAEVELMRAEAAVRGWISTDANTHFAAGVKGAIKAWELFDPSFARTEAEINTYISGRGFATATTENKLRLIGEEYWAATYLNDIESWSNWRRTGYPALTPTKDPNAFEGNFIPRRLRYWETEIGSNPENYAAAVARMGGDLFATRMWWDGGN
ncbi:SusD/RagB family nutrient-binding outer membrane lipoprotein [Algoriphagus mannitolivorans]|uniref:SusD/RagB family nutrient-binding outer membrane lipoprotein n=1 Tax=Algoriphagus mannitolivorans TaxID=226504 RepID=UPI00041790A8|nr:SusD/RagB family nutrient-binding outer membrane lipoprotein [Algoriphagus mannitolivorans]